MEHADSLWWTTLISWLAYPGEPTYAIGPHPLLVKNWRKHDAYEISQIIRNISNVITVEIIPVFNDIVKAMVIVAEAVKKFADDLAYIFEPIKEKPWDRKDPYLVLNTRRLNPTPNVIRKQKLRYRQR